MTVVMMTLDNDDADSDSKDHSSGVVVIPYVDDVPALVFPNWMVYHYDILDTSSLDATILDNNFYEKYVDIL
jgi:hypothetical protein